MDYEKKYKDALERAKSFELPEYKNIMESVFPELSESEDERIWSPSKKQLESLKDLLHYNIGVFDYQKCMEVNSLYEDLIKLLDYETDRQK
jgi:hypothetical protein